MLTVVLVEFAVVLLKFFGMVKLLFVGVVLVVHLFVVCFMVMWPQVFSLAFVEGDAFCVWRGGRGLAKDGAL